MAVLRSQQRGLSMQQRRWRGPVFVWCWVHFVLTFFHYCSGDFGGGGGQLTGCGIRGVSWMVFIVISNLLGSFVHYCFFEGWELLIEA